MKKESKSGLIRAILLIVLSAAIGISIVAPQLISLTYGSYERPIAFWKTLSPFTTLLYLSNYSVFGNYHEGSYALAPPAFLLAVIGICAYFLKTVKERSSLENLAIITLLVGVLISTVPVIWKGVYLISSKSIRCPERFLALSSLGISLFTATGSNTFLVRMNRFRGHAASLIMMLIVVSSLIYVSHLDGDSADKRTRRFLSVSVPIDVIKTMKKELPVRIKSFRSIDSFAQDKLHFFMKGAGVFDGWNLVEKNTFKDSIPAKSVSIPIIEGISSERYIVGHTRIRISDLHPGEEVRIRTRKLKYGNNFITIPSGAEIDVRQKDTELIVRNPGTEDIAELEITPVTPGFRKAIIVSFCVCSGCIVSIIIIGFIDLLKKRIRLYYSS